MGQGVRALFDKLKGPPQLIRYRLGLALVFASLVPIIVVATIGIRVALGGLELAQRRVVAGQIDIAFNLLGKQLERLAIDAARIAGGVGAEMMDAPHELRAVMVGIADELPEALVEFYGASGALIYREVVGDDAGRFAGLVSPMLGDSLRSAPEEQWRRRVHLMSYGDRVLVQATAPIFDTNRRVVGLVALSFPLDEAYLELIKTMLGSEVLVMNAPDVSRPMLPVLRSTFDLDIQPTPAPPPPRAFADLAKGAREITEQTIAQAPYHVAWRAIFDHEDRAVGVLGVAVDRTSLVEAQRLAFRALILAAVVSLILVLGLATWLSRRLGQPVVRLRDSALEVARGNLDLELHSDDRGEIGDLARAFAQMTASLRDAARSQEQKVQERTHELSRANAELEHALIELNQMQIQLVHSERMAGLGLLVAGVAHEINSPTAAIGGAVDALSEIIAQIGAFAAALLAEGVSPAQRLAIFGWIEGTARDIGEQSTPSGVSARRRARALSQTHSAKLLGLGIDTAELARIGIENHHLDALGRLAGGADALLGASLRVLVALTRAQRSTRIIQQAIGRVMRIVSALKTYSHFDQQTPVSLDGVVDLHAGIESTLLLFDFALRGLTVERAFSSARVLVRGMADELNQIWTNLIQNAIHALAGQGTLRISTEIADANVRISVVDDGPGISPEVLPHIFEPFYTTKPKGQGTGLGLGIVHNIVRRHHGTIDCHSRPGQTMFIVTLPMCLEQTSQQP